MCTEYGKTDTCNTLQGLLELTLSGPPFHYNSVPSVHRVYPVSHAINMRPTSKHTTCPYAGTCIESHGEKKLFHGTTNPQNGGPPLVRRLHHSLPSIHNCTTPHIIAGRGTTGKKSLPLQLVVAFATRRSLRQRTPNTHNASTRT